MKNQLKLRALALLEATIESAIRASLESPDEKSKRRTLARDCEEWLAMQEMRAEIEAIIK